MDDITLSDETKDAFNAKMAGIMLFIFGLIGLFVNLCGVFLSFRVPALRSSFGRLMATHCLADAGVLFVFTFWCAPRTFWGFTDHDSILGKRIGQVSLYFWFVSIYSQFFIAMNRFSLLYLPKIYKSVFQNRTRHVIIGYCSICLLHYLVYFGDGCDFYYNSEHFFWEYASTSCGKAMAFWLDFVFGCSVCGIVLLLDLSCVFSLHRGNQVSNVLDPIEKQKRAKREIKFVVQACCNGLLFTLMLFSFHFVSKIVFGLWPVFLTTSFVWELAHTGDGILLLAFNNDLRKVLLQPKMLFSLSTITSRTMHTTVLQQSTTQYRI